MKNSLLVSIILLLSILSVSGQNNANSFPMEDAEWFESETSPWGGTLTSTRYERHFIDGDTIYEGKFYAKLFHEPVCEFWHYIDRKEFYNATPQFIGIFREEDKKVFMRGFSSDTFTGEFKMYDFNMNLGDTVILRWLGPSSPFVVDSVNLINGRKHFVLNPNNPELYPAKIIEGAGFTRGFFGNRYLLTSGILHREICIRIGSENVLKNCSEVCNDPSTSVDQVNVNPDTLMWVYPNPILEELNVQYFSETDSDKELLIVNSMGEVIFKTNLKEFPYKKDDLNELNTGIYLIVILDGQNIVSKKVLKL